MDNNEPMVFISAFTGNAIDTNKYRTDELQRMVRSYQFGCNNIVGNYTMDDGSLSKEQSVVVYAKPDEADELLEFAIEAGKILDHKSVLFVDTVGKAYFYYLKNTQTHKDGEIEVLGKLTTLDADNYFTQIGHKKFKFAEDIIIEDNQNFSYSGMGTPEAYDSIFNRNNIREKVGKPRK